MAKRVVTTDLIDKDEFEKAVMVGLDEFKIADYFMVTTGEMYAWIRMTYREKKPLRIIKKLRAKGELDHLTAQRNLSRKNPTASIFVGKSIYHQKDESSCEDDNTSSKNDIEDLTPLAELLNIKEDKNDEHDSNN